MSDMVKSYFEGPNAIPLDGVIARPALDHVGVDGGFLLYNAGSP